MFAPDRKEGLMQLSAPEKVHLAADLRLANLCLAPFISTVKLERG